MKLAKRLPRRGQAGRAGCGEVAVTVEGIVCPAWKRWMGVCLGDEITRTTFDPLPLSVGGANPFAVTRIP